jgi:hypothetical protein
MTRPPSCHWSPRASAWCEDALGPHDVHGLDDPSAGKHLGVVGCQRKQESGQHEGSIVFLGF